MRISDWSSDVCSSDVDRLTPTRSPVTLSRLAVSVSTATTCAARAASIQRSSASIVVTVSYSARSITGIGGRSEEHTSELQSLMRNSFDVFCLKKNIHSHTYSVQ